MATMSLDGEKVLASIPDNAFNVWGDDFIQSMKTPYGESEYRERSEVLVKEVKVLLREMQSGEMMERLQMVDVLQCLGIDRHFKHEIKLILDSAYKSWDTSVGIRLGSSNNLNLNATALGLRLLRLHRYVVSADVFESFKDNNGQFFFCGDGTIDSSEESVMRGMLNLRRASSLVFPGERVMEEAKTFSIAFLKKLLGNCGETSNKSFLREVEYALVYEYSCTFPRWEARNFIEIYELDDRSLKDKKILELAKLDFNILQFTYKMEMKNLSKWWVDSRVPKVIAMRERTVEYFLWGVTAADEVEFSSARIAISKASVAATIIDDLCDDYGTLDQIKNLKQAIAQGWDVSVVKHMPQNLKMCLEIFFNTVVQLTNEATKEQGRDMMPFVTKAWQDYIEANLEHVRWKTSGHIPTYDEYMTVAKPSACIGPILLHPILLSVPNLSDDSIERIYSNRFKFYDLLWSCIRLIDDARDFEDDKRHGEISSAISSYMRDHPKCSEEEAISHIINLVEEMLKELRCIYLTPNNSLLDWEKICFDLNRGLQFLYIFGDGITFSHKEVKHQVFKVLVDPVVI